MNKEKVVLLLSGGLDSAVCLAMLRAEGHRVIALSFDYNQRHRLEIEHCRWQAQKQEVIEHLILKTDFSPIGGSALTDNSIPVPDGDCEKEPEKNKIPITYVPARNLIFLSYGLAVAESRDARSLVIGVNSLDYSGYPDCRPEFIEKFEEVSKLATRVGVSEVEPIKIRTPLMHLDKTKIVKLGIKLEVDFNHTQSCYNPSLKGHSCGKCDSCLLRLKGFKGAGIHDPVPYL